MVDLDSTLQQIAAIVVAKALEKAQARTEVEPEPVHTEPGPVPIDAYPALIAEVGPDLLRAQRMAKVGRLKSWELLGARRKG